MDTLDNVNNPFAIPNRTNVESITSHADGDLLLNITDRLKKSTDIPNNDLIKMLEKSNCDRRSPEFDKDDNLGPETDVDNPDDGSISPNVDVMKRQSEAVNNDQNFNPFSSIEKSLEINLNLKEGTFDGLTTPTEESCPLPENTVHNAQQLIDDSDSEDEEWNYVRGEEANKENSNPLLTSEVAEVEEEVEDMSQLNPNAAEFVPVSPTRSVTSPLGRVLNEELVLSQSPKKPPSNEELDLNVPNPDDFVKDITEKPHEIEETVSNGHKNDVDNDTTSGQTKSEEFHFGPNAAPFTDFTQRNDPMSMSFYQDNLADDRKSPFDLNKVHVLPDDVDDFISKGDNSNSLLDDSISDLAEHFPLGKPKHQELQASEIIVTDLDNEDNKNGLNIQSSLVTVDRNEETPLEEARIDSPSEQNSPIFSLEERVISPVEQNQAIPSFDEMEMLLPIEKEVSVGVEEKEVCSPVEEKKICSLVEEKEEYSPVKEKEICSLVQEKEVCSLVEEKETCSLFEEKEVCSPVEEAETSSSVEENEVWEVKGRSPFGENEACVLNNLEEVHVPIENKVDSPFKETILNFGLEEKEIVKSPDDDEITCLIKEKDVNSKITEQEIRAADEEVRSLIGHKLMEYVNDKDSLSSDLIVDTSNSPVEHDLTLDIEDVQAVAQTGGELCLSPLKVSCDNLESKEEVHIELSPNNEELCSFETKKSTEENAKENVEKLFEVDSLNTDFEEKYSKSGASLNEIVNISSNTSNPFIIADELNEIVSQSVLDDAPKQEEILEEQLDEFVQKNDKSVPEPNRIHLVLNEDAENIDPHSQPTPEVDQLLQTNQNLFNTSAKSAADTESTTTSLNSFLNRSVLPDLESPLSSDVSGIHVHVDDLLQVERTQECSLVSPAREDQQFLDVTSTPVADRPTTFTPLGSQLAAPVPKSPLEDNTPKAAPNEADKKVSKTKAAAATPAIKKTATPRSSLGPASSSTAIKNGATPRSSLPAKTASPRPASSRLSTKPSPVPSRVMNTSAKTESAAPRCASKPIGAVTGKTTATSTARVPLVSRTKPLMNGDAKPAPKPAARTLKKTTEGSSTARSTSSATSVGKATSTTTARVPLTRTTLTTTAPKPKPTKPAPPKTVIAPKTTVKTTTSAPPRVPAAPPRVPAAPPRVPAAAPKVSAAASKPLANRDTKAPVSKTLPKPRPSSDKQIKETANKLAAARNTSQAVKTTVTKLSDQKVTATTKTTTTTTTTSRPPIKKPSTTTTTMKAVTKVEKPKENGVAVAITEQIIDQQFVKDNSPVDNKLLQ